jgi:lipoprotein-anchoring transpeptidase ErfK/SrfK
MQIVIALAALVLLGQAPVPPKAAAPDALKTQVMLDRAGFSPGAIDGRAGATTKKALALFEKSGRKADPVQPTTRHRLTEEDATGPYQAIPSDMMEKASLPALGYASIVEAIAERFHATPALIARLNPGISFKAGDEIVVPNVEPMVIPAPPPESDAKDPKLPAAADNGNGQQAAAQKPDVTVTVSKGGSALSVTDASGAVIFYAPVTTGSERDPLPIGEWKVNGVQFNPSFRYNPDLFWDADPAHAKATIPPGPNNPVGVVWIDISKEHYGLHGTPEPATIGRTESHGCVRLTNWDALKLAGLVKPGTRVVFTE